MWIETRIKKIEGNGKICRKPTFYLICPFTCGWDKKNSRSIKFEECKNVNLFPLFMYYMSDLAHYAPNKDLDKEQYTCLQNNPESIAKYHNYDKLCYSEYKDNHFVIHVITRMGCGFNGSLYSRSDILSAWMMTNDVEKVILDSKDGTSCTGRNGNCVPTQNEKLFKKYFSYFGIDKIEIKRNIQYNITEFTMCIKKDKFEKSPFFKDKSIKKMITTYGNDLYNDLIDTCLTEEDAKIFINRQTDKEYKKSEWIISYDKLKEICKNKLRK